MPQHHHSRRPVPIVPPSTCRLTNALAPLLEAAGQHQQADGGGSTDASGAAAVVGDAGGAAADATEVTEEDLVEAGLMRLYSNMASVTSPGDAHAPLSPRGPARRDPEDLMSMLAHANGHGIGMSDFEQLTQAETVAALDASSLSIAEQLVGMMPAGPLPLTPGPRASQAWREGGQEGSDGSNGSDGSGGPAEAAPGAEGIAARVTATATAWVKPMVLSERLRSCALLRRLRVTEQARRNLTREVMSRQRRMEASLAERDTLHDSLQELRRRFQQQVRVYVYWFTGCTPRRVRGCSSYAARHAQLATRLRHAHTSCTPPPCVLTLRPSLPSLPLSPLPSPRCVTWTTSGAASTRASPT